jgi:hypothetical protein
MNVANANLETGTPQPQPNSQADNKGQAVSNGSAPNKTNQQQAEAPKPKSLAELFGDSTDETNLEISLSDDTPDDPNAPLDSIERLMKRHKLTPEQAYAIKVPMPNGAEALSIGELKDKISDLTDLEYRQTEFEERRIKTEGDILRSQSELRDILSLLPKDAIKPEVLNKLRERQEFTTRRERQLTIQHIPEWRDEKKRLADLEGIEEMLSDYGFDGTFLQAVTDHRAMKFIRDTFLIRTRIQKSLAAVRDPKNLGARPSGKSGKAAAKPGVKSRRQTKMTQDDKLAELFSS